MDNMKLIVSEIDGIITDGTMFIDELGNVPFKNFNVEDFDSINKLKKDCNFVFLSDDNRVSYNECRRRNIPFYWAKQKSKVDILLDIMRRYNVSPEETIYLGSKASDIGCMRLVPLSFCPEGSSKLLASIGSKLETGPGKGVITELYFYYFFNKKNL